MKRFCDYAFHALKTHFNTPFLEFTDRDLLREIDGEEERENDMEE